jgi:hypothetical protein
LHHEARLVKGIWRSEAERAVQGTSRRLSGAAAGFFTKEMLSNSAEFSPRYAEWSQERLAAWKELRRKRKKKQKIVFETGSKLGICFALGEVLLGGFVSSRLFATDVVWARCPFDVVPDSTSWWRKGFQVKLFVLFFVVFRLLDCFQ